MDGFMMKSGWGEKVSNGISVFRRGTSYRIIEARHGVPFPLYSNFYSTINLLLEENSGTIISLRHK